MPVDPNPGTDGLDANTVAPPTNLTVTEETYSTGAGSGVKGRLLIDWDPSPDGFLLAYQVEMKLQSVTDWDQTHILGRTATTETHGTVDDVAVGFCHVRVAAINTVERRSTFIQESVTVSGDTSPPEDVTGFIQEAGVSGISRFFWNGSIDQRVRDGGATVMKYQAVTTGATWAAAGFTYAGSQHAVQFAATYDFSSDGPLYNSSFFAVTAGEKYLLRTATQRTTGGGTHTRNLIIELQFFRYDTTTSSWIGVSAVDGNYTQALDTDPANSWVVRDSNTYHGTDNITVPTLASRARVVVYSEGGGSTGGLYWLGLVSVFKRNPAALIVDGGVIAQTIATDAVTTNKVQAGAITAAKISVSQLSAISADVGSLTAGTITGLTIRTGSGTTRVEIASSGSYPNALTAYVSGTAVATFGGTMANGDGFIQVAGNFSLIYPARFINTSTTGGGSATGGGAAFIKSEGGWALQVDQSSTTAGTWNRTVTARITNIGSGGGGLEIGASNGDGGFAAYAFAGTYTPFTGSHDALMDKTAAVPEVGDLLVTVDTVAVTISDTMPVVALSSEARQPAICGAFLNRRPADPDKPPSAMMEDYMEYREVNGVWMDVHPPVPEWGPLTEDYDVVFFNGVGEGGVNACNQGGDIEPGDLLCSSSIPGKVMRQGDDVVHSYTVGKTMGRTTFAGPADFRMIGVFYTSG